MYLFPAKETEKPVVLIGGSPVQGERCGRARARASQGHRMLPCCWTTPTLALHTRLGLSVCVPCRTLTSLGQHLPAPLHWWGVRIRSVSQPTGDSHTHSGLKPLGAEFVSSLRKKNLMFREVQICVRWHGWSEQNWGCLGPGVAVRCPSGP